MSTLGVGLLTSSVAPWPRTLITRESALPRALTRSQACPQLCCGHAPHLPYQEEAPGKHSYLLHPRWTRGGGGWVPGAGLGRAGAHSRPLLSSPRSPSVHCGRCLQAACRDGGLGVLWLDSAPCDPGQTAGAHFVSCHHLGINGRVRAAGSPLPTCLLHYSYANGGLAPGAVSGDALLYIDQVPLDKYMAIIQRGHRLENGSVLVWQPPKGPRWTQELVAALQGGAIRGGERVVRNLLRYGSGSGLRLCGRGPLFWASRYHGHFYSSPESCF